jgi:hypothetical protein
MTVADGSQSHRDAFHQVREFSKKFKELNGSIVCREILGVDINDREAFREAVQKGIPQKICPKMVQDAAEIVERLLA